MKKHIVKRLISLILIVSVTVPLVTNHVSASTLFPSGSNESLNSAEAVLSENDSDQISDDVEREKIIEKTENSTTYQRTDGSKEVIMYSSDVRYRDEQNKLIDYDPSLVKITDDTIEENNLEGYRYENKQGDTKQYIPTNLTEETPVLLQFKDYQVTLRPVFAGESIEAVSLEVKGNTFTNEEITNNDKIEQVLDSVDQGLLPKEDELDEAVLASEKTVDIYDNVKTRPTKTTYSTTDNAISLEYISQDTGIKENIILNEKPDTNVFLYELTVKNAYPRENGIDGGITFYDKISNDIIGNIPAPFMNDATNNAYSEDLSFTIGLKEGTDDTYIVALTVNPEYLNSPERQYPVTIDPSYIWTGETDVADTYVLNGTYENTNFYSSAVTTFSVGDGSQGLYRTYIRFADFWHKLSGYYVDSAKLTVYETGNSQANNTIQVHRVTEDWSKTTVNWVNRPNYSTTPITSAVTSGVAGRAKIFDITSNARQVANGTYTSYGIMLRANDESSSGLYSQFYSSRYSNEALRPKLTVIYYDGPTTASSVTLNSAYIKPGATATINWSGINSQSLNMVQYHIYNYDDETATLGSEIIGYSSSTKIGTTSTGSSTIPATASLSEGCYRIYVRGVDNGGIKGAGKGVTLHIDGTAPTLSTAEISPKTTSVFSYSNKVPILEWSGGSDDHFSQVEYSINGSAYEKAGSTSGTIDLLASSFSTAGLYTINVRAKDKSVNYSTVKTLSYYYDPNVSNSNIPEITKVQFTNTTNASPDIAITSIRPDGTSVAVSKVYYYMAASTSTTEPTDDQYILTTSISNNGDITNLKLNSTETSKGNGVYKLYIKIQDANNNTSEPFLAAYYRMVNVVYDNAVTLSATYNEDDNVIALSWNGDSNISSVKLYKRYGEDTFKYGQTINTGTSVNISTENIEDTADFRLLVTYLDGSQKASNIISVLNESQIDENTGSEVLKYTVTTFDSDFDTLADGYEMWQHNTSYLDDDTDDDGITDENEINKLITNPLTTDTDNDGFSDGYEVSILGTDPTMLTANEDSDNDSIDNLIEYRNNTNPYLKDTDFDGLNDNEDSEPLKTNLASGVNPNYNVEIHVGLYDNIEETIIESGFTKKIITNIYTGDIVETCKYTDDEVISKTNYFYDNYGNNTAIISYAEGKYHINTYTYDENRLTEVYHNGFKYGIFYDESGQLKSINIGNKSLLSYTYNENGHLTDKNYANGQSENLVYDENTGLLKNVKINNQLAYDFSKLGNVTLQNDYINGIIYTYTYNPVGNLESISGDDGFSIKYINNSVNDDLVKGSTAYSDNGVERRTEYEVTESSDDETGSYATTSTTLLISGSEAKSVVNCIDDTITVTNTISNSENAKVLEQIITQGTSSITIENQDSDKIIYNYDQNGNITKIYNNEILFASYEYDGFNQLVRENDKTSNKTVVYKYDNNGNISGRTEYDYTVGNLGEVKRSIVYGYSTSEWKDLLETYDNQTITYDANGNPIQYRDGIHLTWTNGRLLANSQSYVYDITYKYNYDGLRKSKTVNNISNGTNSVTKYYYDEHRLIKEISGNDIIWYLYDIDGLLVGFELNGDTYYYEKNIQGDIIKIYDTIGNEVVSYTYDAWGEITSISGNQTLGEKNQFRYRGYYYDKETGFYYIGSRYYDPNTGRFINADDPSTLALNNSYSLLSPNLFAYCNNNPVNYYDPDGHSPEAIAVGGSTFAAFCAWLEVIGGANWWNPVGWTIAGIFATGVVTWAGLSLYNKWKASASSKTKVLSDVKASIKSKKVYYLAYVNSVGELIKIGESMSFVEALAALGITGATNTLSKVYKYDRGRSSDAQRELQKKSDNWGIYTHDQAAAKALAVVLGAKPGTEEGTPKVHSSGMYGHYHDSTHTFHIWFGGKIVY